VRYKWIETGVGRQGERDRGIETVERDGVDRRGRETGV